MADDVYLILQVGGSNIGIRALEPTPGKTIISIPVGKSDISIRPANTYQGDEGIMLQRPSVFVPGVPPNYLPDSWETGFTISCSQGSPVEQYDEYGNLTGYYLPGGYQAVSERVLLRRATEGLESFCSSSVLVAVFDDADNLYGSGSGSGAIRFPISPTNRAGFGKMNDYLTVVAYISIPGEYSGSPSPRSVSGTVKIVTIGRY